MKQQNIKFLFVMFMCMLGGNVSAHDIAMKNVDGKTIYYSIVGNAELWVSYCGDSYYSYSDRYFGNVVIPEYVPYNGKIYPVTGIGYSAFRYCSSLTSVTIPNSVTYIGNEVFYDCNNLTSVNIPNSVTGIGDYMFDDCSGLMSITIPNSVTYIGQFAFSGCSGLTSVIIPNSVTSIGRYAFRNCSSLTSVTIGNSVASIGEFVFSGCSLTEVKVLAATPPFAYDYSFSNYNIPLYVPEASVGDYQSANPLE